MHEWSVAERSPVAFPKLARQQENLVANATILARPAEFLMGAGCEQTQALGDFFCAYSAVNTWRMSRGR